MVLTSPRAYNFNCAPQSSQYLYTMPRNTSNFKLRFQSLQKIFLQNLQIVYKCNLYAGLTFFLGLLDSVLY